jgi:primase-polymerase (primpol)-like protein
VSGKQNQDPIPLFPATLKARKTWCLWRYEERDGKRTKVPYQVSGVPARSNDRRTWATFEAACSAISGQTEFDLGIFADGSHAFVDLDKCIGSDATIEPWAEAVLCRTNSYAERSPSGSGLHIFLAGAVTKASKINGCEIYNTARFFTVTGKQIPGTPSTVNMASVQDLEELRDDIAQNRLRPYDYKTREPLASSGILVAKKPPSGSERKTRLERALSGDTSEYRYDTSAAVHGVLQFLARKHEGDREEMAEEFEASRLCSDWGSKWDRLREKELDKAIDRWRKNGEPAWNYVTTCVDSNNWRSLFHAREETETAPPITFAIENFLQEGGITMLGGLPGHDACGSSNGAGVA